MIEPEFTNVDPESETDVIIRNRREEQMDQPAEHGHGSGGYRMDQRDLLKWVLTTATIGTIGIITWLVLQAFALQSGVAMLNLKVDMVMERMHIEQPKAAK